MQLARYLASWITAAGIVSGSAAAQLDAVHETRLDPGGWLGYSVALDGDTLVLGMRSCLHCPHEVYVYVRSGAGWAEQAHLTAPWKFGQSVDVSGDTIIVGAPTNWQPGRAYVYSRSGSTWSEEAVLLPDDTQTIHDFGRSVAIDGDTAVVGAYTGGSKTYVFVRSGTTWSLQRKFHVGPYADISGDRLAIGDPYDRRVYMRSRTGTTWTNEGVLTLADPQYFFGFSVAFDGDTVLVGSPYGPGSAKEGAAYVFVLEATGGWAMQQELRPCDVWNWAKFGESVALSGDVAVIGAPGIDDEGNPKTGAAYVFERRGGRWTQEERLSSSEALAWSWMGKSAAVERGTAVLGAPGRGAYVYELAVPDPHEGRFVGINVDVVGSPPTSSFGAASGQAGTWNGVHPTPFERELVGVDGGATGATINACGGLYSYAFDEPATTADVERLLDDGKVRPSSWTVTGLAAGEYDVWVYCHDPRDPTGSTATVWIGGGVAGVQTCGGRAWNGSWIEGGHFVRDRVSIGDAPLSIHVSAGSPGTVCVNGLQIVPVDVGTESCFGIGCSCGNDDPAAGCANSTGKGARISGRGSASVAADDLVLEASGLPVGSIGFFVMSDAPVLVPLLDGLQCVGGTRLRFDALATVTDVLGTLELGPGIAASAGGLVLPGTTWHFQGVYRDRTSPCGAGGNFTSLSSVSFVP